MKQFSMSKSAILMTILLGIGLLGTIVFFPVNIQDRYTCLYHRLFYSDHPHSYSNDAAFSTAEKTVGAPLDQSVDKPGHDGSTKIKEDDLVSFYLIPFGLLWWGNMLIMGFSIYGLKRLSNSEVRSRKTSHQSSQTIN